MVKLSARLSKVASFIPDGAYLADIGSDHAYLPIYLVEQGRISIAQAIDNKMAPYLRMKNNVNDAGYSAKISCSLSSGLDEVRPDVDCLAICGVGGLLTCQMLEEGKSKLENIKTIVLDPHRDLKAVRERVSALGFHLEDEAMIYEGKIYYSIMKWGSGAPQKKYSLDELEFGPILMRKKEPIFLEWMGIQLKKVSGILNMNLSPEKRQYYLDLYRRIKAQIS